MNHLTDFFPRLINMSAIASIVILFVLAARLILKRAPKIFSYALWAIVLIRLFLPASITSPVSLIPDTPSVSGKSINGVLPDFDFETIGDRIENKQSLQQAMEEGNPVTVRVGHSLEPVQYLTFIWMIGIAAMILFSCRSYYKIKNRVRIAVPLRENIWIADDIKSPFVIGYLKPRIYLPCSLGKKEQEYIIIHEQHHIRRFDHIIKALAFLALAVHWFNPLVWIAFVMACKDMEMSCDEAVISKLGTDVRADYSASLLTLASGHRIIASTPLAFVEGETMSRIKNISKWKKPAIWVIIICVILCLVSVVCLLTNPETYNPIELPHESAETIEYTLHNDSLPDGYYEEHDDNGNIIFTDGSNTVGGILCYRIPEGFYDPDEHIEVILYRMGIPDYMDTSLYFRGGMTSGDNGWLAEFESDVPEGEDPTVYRRHHFYPIEGVVYDIWFDMIQLDHETAEEIRVCVNLPSE